MAFPFAQWPRRSENSARPRGLQIWGRFFVRSYGHLHHDNFGHLTAVGRVANQFDRLIPTRATAGALALMLISAAE